MLKFGIGPRTRKSVTLPSFPVINPYKRSDIFPRAPDKIRNNEIKGSSGSLVIWFRSHAQTKRDSTNVYSAWPANSPQAMPVLYVTSKPIKLLR